MKAGMAKINEPTTSYLLNSLYNKEVQTQRLSMKAEIPVSSVYLPAVAVCS